MARLGVTVAIALLASAVGGGSPLRALPNTSPRAGALRLQSQLLAQGTVQAGRRWALVIGNGAYAEERLANAVNDAEEVARTLQEIGFAVTLVRNADKRRIDEAVELFSRQLGAGEIGLFYFSGHGVQVDGVNYLVPVNAQLKSQADAQYDAVPLGKILNVLNSTSATAKIIILDACRNNPFYRRWRSTARGVASRGMATPQISGSGGTLIAFSTAPGMVAADKINNSKNSPFTTHLLRHLRTPNLEVGQLFRRVRRDVVQATRNEQIPWVSEALVGEVYLHPQIAAPAVGVQPAVPSPAPALPQPVPAAELQAPAAQSARITSPPERLRIPPVNAYPEKAPAALKPVPDHDPMGIGKEAIKMLRTGQPQMAARLAERLVQLLPNDPRGWALLAEAQLRSNNPKEALNALARAKSLDPDNPGLWFAEGSLALLNGKPDEAIELIQHGLRQDPRNAGAYFDLGSAHILLNEPKSALRALERAAALRDNFWEAINNQGLVLYELGQDQQALKRWRKVLSIKPGLAEASLALASALYGQSLANRAEAFRLAESALAVDPNYVNEDYQKGQLWGPRLREAASALLAHPSLIPAVERAKASATGSLGSQ